MPIPCPECGATSLSQEESGHWRCPQCGLVTEAAQVPCPACGGAVDFQADACPACGESTTLFGQVMSRHDGKGRAPMWLSQARARASVVRREEDHASSRRFDALMEIDRRRIQALEQDARAQARKDRRTLAVGLGVAAGLAVLTLLIALAAWAR